MELDPDHCYQAVQARDARFDGAFFVGVSTTGIYCRPVCTVRVPRREHSRFFADAAAAEAAGFRPCLRCRPELAPGASPLDSPRRTADIAVARIEAGALTDGGVDALAAELGVSARQLRRLVQQAYGVTPVELAQTRRLLLAKQLLTDTSMRVAEVAFAAGFSSVRRFNHLFRSRYRLTPSALRRRRPAGEPQAVTLKLGYRPPLAWSPLVTFLGGRGAPAVEQTDGVHYYRRTVRIGEHTGWIEAVNDPRRPVVRISVAPSLLPVLTPLRARLRHLFDLDATPGVIDAHLSGDPRLADAVAAAPGLRVPGAIDGFEIAVRTVIGQQIAVRAATTVFTRLIERFGAPTGTPWPDLNRLFPTPRTLAEAPLQSIIDCGLPSRRAGTIQALARAVADDAVSLAPTATLEATTAALTAIPGIGPWTSQYVAMRALADPDAFPESDLALRRAVGAERPADVRAGTLAWRPWRAYAAMHLWHRSASGG
ncbi:helix-turn-helix domain-containing protein [Arhodomonas aquaeolei]|uniref:DNA-3-methyladenine glycosylase 2 n=1 Tax=Arhodomonas aquaeolei TaxID=2369 RepID=UPI0021679865|nr:DNA-3-methyladenine glycosylase 2 [Arhodomonas aquaeolei]MCS4503758.1 helix-turn-helix domain-containing protein [Arhodomonas aquaeolei]